MDLHFTPEDEAFRAEARGPPRRPPHRRVRRGPRPGRPRRRARPVRRALGLGAAPGRPRLDLRGLAERARRARPHPAPAGHLVRGVRPGPGARPARPHRRGPGRAHRHPLRRRTPSRHGSCPASWPAPSCGARATPSPTPAATWPTSRPGPSRDGDDWVHRRPEGVDLAGPVVRLVLRAGPHRPRRPQAQGHLVLPGAAWTRTASRSAPSARSPAPPSSTRSSSTAPGPPARRRGRRRRQRLEGGHGPAGLRAGRLDPRPAAGFRNELDAVVDGLPAAAAGSTTRSLPPAAGRACTPARDHALEQPAGPLGVGRRRAPRRR